MLKTVVSAAVAGELAEDKRISIPENQEKSLCRLCDIIDFLYNRIIYPVG